jgi:hypothetical protein
MIPFDEEKTSSKLRWQVGQLARQNPSNGYNIC